VVAGEPPGSAAVSTTAYDGYGEPVWSMDADGFFHYTASDPVTGAVTDFHPYAPGRRT
jgi:hypothetical protein